MIDDKRRHDDRLARARGHFEGDAGKVGGDIVGSRLGLGEPGQHMLAGIGALSDFVQPDGGLDGFALGVEKPVLARGIEKPIGEQFAGDTGGVGVRFPAPDFDFSADQVHQLIAVGVAIFVHFQQIFLRTRTHGDRLHVWGKDAPAFLHNAVVQLSGQVGCVVKQRLLVGIV